MKKNVNYQSDFTNSPTVTYESKSLNETNSRGWRSG